LKGIIIRITWTSIVKLPDQLVLFDGYFNLHDPFPIRRKLISPRSNIYIGNAIFVDSCHYESMTDILIWLTSTAKWRITNTENTKHQIFVPTSTVPTTWRKSTKYLSWTYEVTRLIYTSCKTLSIIFNIIALWSVIWIFK